VAESQALVRHVVVATLALCLRKLLSAPGMSARTYYHFICLSYMVGSSILHSDFIGHDLNTILPLKGGSAHIIKFRRLHVQLIQPPSSLISQEVLSGFLNDSPIALAAANQGCSKDVFKVRGDQYDLFHYLHFFSLLWDNKLMLPKNTGDQMIPYTLLHQDRRVLELLTSGLLL
jgi:hypothetical protein